METSMSAFRSRAQLRATGAKDFARGLPQRARDAARRPEMIGIGLLAVVGFVLRAFFVYQWRPALVGFPDTVIYVQDARVGIFNDPLHVGGYSEFLRLMYAIRPHLSFAVIVQHALGVASGLLLFGAVRRARLPRGLGLVPAGFVLLGGSEIFIEHAALSEALFIFLVDLALYALVRAWRGHWGWAVLAGLAAGASADVRTVGLVLLVVLVPSALLAFSAPWRERALRAVLVLLAAALPVGGYLAEHENAVGYGGFTGAGYFDLYARVAPFAECAKFHPPAGTRRLCINIARSRRPGHDYWEFTAISPAVRAFGEPDVTAAQPGENAKLREFAVAAILAQPGDYLEAVGRDLIRIVDPSFTSSTYAGNVGYGNTPESLVSNYLNTSLLTETQRVLREYYPAGDGEVHRDISFLRGYERATRVEGPLMALLLLLALAAPLLTSGEARRTALLFLICALVLLAVPAFISEYDYRFTIPAVGPLAATAAIGAWAIFGRARRRLRPAPATDSGLGAGDEPAALGA